MGTLLLLGAGGTGTAAAAAPVNVVAPVISGTNVVGNVLTVTTGTWTGSPAPTFTYWWKRNGSPVTPIPTPGATTYNLSQLDAGVNITCEVYATNPSGTASATSNSIFVYDADAQAFFNAESTAGVTLTTTEKNAINTLVVNCKAANIWTKFKALYPFIGSTATSQKFNLKNPADTNAAYRLTFSGGWTHTSNGIQANGSNTYASTYLIPNTHLTLRNTHLSSYVRTDTVAGNKMDIGCGIAPSSIPLMTLSSKYGTTTVTSDAYTYAGNRIAVSNTDARGFYIGTRTSINSHKVYKNGSLVGTDTNNESQGSMPNVELFVGAYNQSGSVLQVSDRQYAFISIGDGLTDLEAQVFNQIVEQYQFALGRNINPAQSFYYNTAYNNETNAYLYSTQITDTTTQVATNTLVNDLKTAGVWTKMKAIYPMVGTTATQQKFNLVNSQDTNAAFRLTFAGGWTHSSTGALPNGSNTYANTNLTPSIDFAVDHNKHLSFYSRTNAATAGFSSSIGSDNGSNGFCRFTIRQSSNARSAIFGGTNGTMIAAAETDSRGFYVATRPTSTTSIYYKNGSSIATGASTNGTTSQCTLSLLIGAANSNGTITYFDNKEVAFASIGDSLSSAEVASYSTIVQNFQTALGRQV